MKPTPTMLDEHQSKPTRSALVAEIEARARKIAAKLPPDKPPAPRFEPQALIG